MAEAENWVSGHLVSIPSFATASHGVGQITSLYLKFPLEFEDEKKSQHLGENMITSILAADFIFENWLYAYHCGTEKHFE